MKAQNENRMMFKKNINRNFFGLLLAFFSSCQTLDLAEPDSPLKLNLFSVPDGSYSNSNQLKATIKSEDGLHLGFFGVEGQIRSLLVTDENEKTETVILLDDNGAPAFMYGIVSKTGKKEEGLVEFEPIQDGIFFMRFYHYDWSQRIGTLLVEAKVSKSGQNWVTETTFVTKNTELTGIKSRLGGKGGSFYSPIPRLDRLNFRKSNLLKTQDIVGDFAGFIDNFRKQDIPNFLKEYVEPAGIIGVVAGAVGVAAGSPAWVPVFLGGVAVAAGSYVTRFFLDDGMERILTRLESAQNTLNNGLNVFKEGTIELLDNYQTPLEGYWNNLNVFENPETTLEDVLVEIEDKDLLNNPEDLDDLPDSQGVIHIAMSWNSQGTDIDLWVTDPRGEKIYYENPNSNSGGYLDLDDTDGLGPENIYWRSGAPDGVYKVAVHYFGCDNVCNPTSYKVKVSNGLGTVRNYEGILAGEDVVANVITFTKQGSNLIF